MDLATSEELVSAVQDWPRNMYSDTEIESRRTVVWRYLVGERETYTAVNCPVSSHNQTFLPVPAHPFQWDDQCPYRR
ncbi:hypothetical protein LINGRAHAP2_LOCUS4711 [Linum grandiflorum]